MSDVTLSKAVRSNLLHLQNTAQMMDRTQERLATGKKVNSALDNPTNFFTASSLNARAADIGTLLDAMSNGIQTIEAADNGLTAITKTLESMQSTLRQARQDNTFQMTSFSIEENLPANSQLAIFGGATGATDTAPIEIELTKDVTAIAAVPSTVTSESAQAIDAGSAGNLVINGVTVALADGDSLGIVAAKINDAMVAASNDISASIVNGELVISKADGQDFGIAGSATSAQLGLTDGTNPVTIDNGTEAGGTTTVNKTVDELVREINNTYKTSLRASNDRGMLRIENLSTTPLGIHGASGGTIDGSPASEATIDGNTTRSALADQFNALRSELDRLAEDASYNGVNLLRGDDLKIVFNEMGTSLITIETKDAHGNPRPINSNEIGLLEINPADLETDENVDALLHSVQLALGEVRAQASDLGSTLSVVQNREQFTREMINTLQSGAANLTLADSNEEAANMLALQTRQQLSQTALSLASQADQSVLRLFG